MKINVRAYRSFNEFEPIEVQEINGKKVEIFFMNDSKYLSQYVPRGRFYFWTSDGKGYRLIVERGFYYKVSYFFSEQINEIWTSFLDDLGSVYGKNNRLYLLGTIGFAAVVMILGAIIFPEQLIWVMMGVLVLTMITNAMQSKKLSATVREKNLKAQEEIREVLTDEGFEKLLQEQEEYMREYFEIEPEDVTEETEALEDTFETAEDDLIVEAEVNEEDSEVEGKK